jgi:hypothetical protein
LLLLIRNSLEEERDGKAQAPVRSAVGFRQYRYPTWNCTGCLLIFTNWLT